MQGMPPTLGATRALQLAAGVEPAPDTLAERLSELGYTRVDVVEHRGEFAVRGGVVDLFPGIARRPARLEYWGDEIESLREFAAATQLSHGAVFAWFALPYLLVAAVWAVSRDRAGRLSTV